MQILIFDLFINHRYDLVQISRKYNCVVWRTVSSTVKNDAIPIKKVLHCSHRFTHNFQSFHNLFIITWKTGLSLSILSLSLFLSQYCMSLFLSDCCNFFFLLIVYKIIYLITSFEISAKLETVFDKNMLSY